MSKNNKSSTPKTHTAYRDAKTGQFTTEKYADKHPDTTVKERVPNPGRGDTK